MCRSLLQYRGAKLSLILNYAVAEIEERQKEYAYKIYISDSIRNLTQILAQFCGAKNLEIPRFADMIENPVKPKKELKSEDVINKFMQKFGIKG